MLYWFFNHKASRIEMDIGQNVGSDDAQDLNFLKSSQYVCEKCGKEFQSQLGMKKHERKLKCPPSLTPRAPPASLKAEPMEALTCGQCDFKFKDIRGFTQHFKTASDHKTVCVPCDSQFKSFNYLRQHLQRYHFKRGRIICIDCGKLCTSEEHYKQHWNNVHKVAEDLYCNLCTLKCQNMMKLRKHMRYICLKRDPVQVEVERRKNLIINGDLGLVFKWTKQRYLDHKKAFDAGKETFNEIPEEAMQSTVKKDNIKVRHKKTDHRSSLTHSPEEENETVKIETEDLEIGTEEENMDIQETEKRPEVVEHKEKTEKTEEEFKENGDEKKSINGDIEVERKEKSLVKEELLSLGMSVEEVENILDGVADTCENIRVAGKEEETMKEELNHRDEKEEIMNNNNVVQDKKPARTCHHCGKIMSTKDHLKRHIRNIHEKNIEESVLNKIKVQHMCTLCGKMLSSEGCLFRHNKNIHEGIERKKIECHECGKSYTKDNFNNHIDYAHTINPVQCDTCGKEMKNKGALRNHMMKVHIATDNVKCTECGKDFPNKIRLYHHTYSVHSYKKSECERCGKKYKNVAMLQAHKRFVHKNTSGDMIR